MHIQRYSNNISIPPFSHIRTKSSDNTHTNPNPSNSQHLQSQQHFIYNIVPSHQQPNKNFRLKQPHQLHYEGDLTCFDKVKPFQTNIRTVPKNVNNNTQLNPLKGVAQCNNHNIIFQLNKEQHKIKQKKRYITRKSPVPLTRNYLLQNNKQLFLLNDNYNNNNNQHGVNSNSNKELSPLVVVGNKQKVVNKSPVLHFPKLFNRCNSNENMCCSDQVMFSKKLNRISNINSSSLKKNNTNNEVLSNNNNSSAGAEIKEYNTRCNNSNSNSSSYTPDFSGSNNKLIIHSHNLKTFKLKSNNNSNNNTQCNSTSQTSINNNTNKSFTKPTSNTITKPDRSHSQSSPNILKELPLPSSNLNTPHKKIRNIYQFTHVGFDGEHDKPHNQDVAFIEQHFANNNTYFYMSVCDGHGYDGHSVSGYIKKILPKKLTRLLKGKDLERPSPGEKLEINKLIIKAFKSSNNDLIRNTSINSIFSGSTCVSVIFTPSKLISANIGDSRAVIGRIDESTSTWLSYNLTRDHKPTDKDEAKRILNASGRIQAFVDEDTGEFVGPKRVWLKEDDVPGLAMTRSFGDRVAATIGVICEPEILEYELTDKDKFVLIASDGVWEFMSSSEVVDIIKEFYIKNDMKGCCEYLYLESKKRWLREEEVVDDITMVLVFYDK
jgi:serine/threonine protein phosphatase PrpC